MIERTNASSTEATRFATTAAALSSASAALVLSQTQPTATTEEAGQTRQSRDATSIEVKKILSALDRSEARLKVVSKALDQLGDLLGGLRKSLADAADRNPSSLSRRRLVQTAADTANDIIDHASFGGRNVFKENSPLQSGGIRDARVAGAVGAYARNSSRFAADTDDEPPRIRNAMTAVQYGVLGPRGISSTLRTLGSQQDDDPLVIDREIGRLRTEIGSLSGLLSETRKEWIEAPREQIGRGGPVPMLF